MKKIVVAVLCTMTVVASGSLVYGGMFDSLKSAVSSGGSGGGDGVTKTAVDNYFKYSNTADKLQDNSIDALAKMLLNKDQVAEIERKMEAAKAIQDPKEREAAMNKVKVEEQAAVEKAANEKDSLKKLGTLNDDQKKQASGAISNLFLSALNNKSAVEVAKNIVQASKSSPSSALGFASEMTKIKDGMVTLPGKIEKTYTVANQLVKLAQDNKIEVPIPKSAADQPKEVSI